MLKVGWPDLKTILQRSNAIRGVIGGDLAERQSVSGGCRFDRFIDHILKARNGTERHGSKT